MTNSLTSYVITLELNGPSGQFDDLCALLSESRLGRYTDMHAIIEGLGAR